jgi:hypothetical protein
MNPRLKKIIFDKLNEDLSTVEIIVAENKSIWFIDRANKYWYFELEKSGKLWWRYEFFIDFFILFSLKTDEFQPLLSEWVEGVLNCRVSATLWDGGGARWAVEGVLNCRVSATIGDHAIALNQVEGVLNCGVNTIIPGDWNSGEAVEGVLNQGIVTSVEVGLAGSGVTEGILRHGYRKGSRKVEEVLNREVDTNTEGRYNKPRQVDKVLNREINEIDGGELIDNTTLEKVLNPKVVSILPANLQNELVQQILVNELIYEVESADPLDTPAHDSVDEVLSYKVTRTIPDLNESLADVERLLDSNQ